MMNTAGTWMPILHRGHGRRRAVLISVFTVSIVLLPSIFTETRARKSAGAITDRFSFTGQFRFLIPKLRSVRRYQTVRPVVVAALRSSPFLDTATDAIAVADDRARMVGPTTAANVKPAESRVLPAPLTPSRLSVPLRKTADYAPHHTGIQRDLIKPRETDLNLAARPGPKMMVAHSPIPERTTQPASSIKLAGFSDKQRSALGAGVRAPAELPTNDAARSRTSALLVPTTQRETILGTAIRPPRNSLPPLPLPLLRKGSAPSQAQGSPSASSRSRRITARTKLVSKPSIRRKAKAAKPSNIYSEPKWARGAFSTDK